MSFAVSGVFTLTSVREVAAGPSAALASMTNLRKPARESGELPRGPSLVPARSTRRASSAIFHNYLLLFRWTSLATIASFRQAFR